MTSTDSPTPGPAPLTTTITEPRNADTGRGGDHLRHIICTTCFPAFVGTRDAPQDALCICGKPILKGDTAGPSTAQQCIVCDELADHHFETMHAGADR